MQKIFKFKKCYFFSTYGSITKGSSRTPHYLNKIIQFKYYSLFMSACQCNNNPELIRGRVASVSRPVLLTHTHTHTHTHTLSGWGHSSKSVSPSLCESLVELSFPDPHPASPRPSELYCTHLFVWIICYMKKVFRNDQWFATYSRSYEYTNKFNYELKIKLKWNQKLHLYKCYKSFWFLKKINAILSNFLFIKESWRRIK